MRAARQRHLTMVVCGLERDAARRGAFLPKSKRSQSDWHAYCTSDHSHQLERKVLAGRSRSPCDRADRLLGWWCPDGARLRDLFVHADCRVWQLEAFATMYSYKVDDRIVFMCRCENVN